MDGTKRVEVTVADQLKFMDEVRDDYVQQFADQQYDLAEQDGVENVKVYADGREVPRSWKPDS